MRIVTFELTNRGIYRLVSDTIKGFKWSCEHRANGTGSIFVMPIHSGPDWTKCTSRWVVSLGNLRSVIATLMESHNGSGSENLLISITYNCIFYQKGRGTELFSKDLVL